jgi:hypothetical protein
MSLWWTADLQKQAYSLRRSEQRDHAPSAVLLTVLPFHLFRQFSQDSFNVVVNWNDHGVRHPNRHRQI